MLQHFILMEFDGGEAIREVLKSCGHSDRSQIIPTHSHMLWFRANNKKKLSANTNSLGIPLKTSVTPVSHSQLVEWLRNADSVSFSQINVFSHFK